MAKNFLTSVLLCLLVVVMMPAVNAQGAVDEEAVYAKLVGFASGSEEEFELPLKHTDVKAEVTGYISKVQVEQEYENNFEYALEAIYVFPLPANAAINSMEMIIGDRVIKAVMKEREEARQIYETAKQEGKRTSLLEQERPNVFTQSVANIMPGDKITIKITYVETLAYDSGKYNFVFPMVVGPRYTPAEDAPAAEEGIFEDDDIGVTTRTKRNISPPVLPPNTRSGHDISLSVHINTGNIPIKDIRSTSHEINNFQVSLYEANVSLKQEDSIVNKDFALSYDVSGTLPEVAVLNSKKPGEDGYFTLMIQPPAVKEQAMILPKEMIFIVDVSGSMSGVPIDLSKKAMEHTILNLNSEDTFNILLFAHNVISFASEPQPATDDNLKKAVDYVRNIKAGGGTEMMPAVNQALDYPLPMGKIRIISLMTDGMIGNDDQVISTIQKKKNEQIRFFPFSIGAAPNTYLLDRMAELGRGKAFYIGNNDDPQEAVDDFYKRIDAPVFINLDIDWGSLSAYDVYPAELPDLFVGEPVYVHGRYKNAGTFNIGLTGLVSSIEGSNNTINKINEFLGKSAVKAEEQTITVRADFSDSAVPDNGIDFIWARNKIKNLMNKMRVADDPEKIKQEIIQTGIAYNLMTNYTAFVAVEEEVVNESGQVKMIEIPVELPEGTTYEGFFGSKSFNNPMSSGGLVDGLLWGATQAEIMEGTGLGSSDPRIMAIMVRNLAIVCLLLILFILSLIAFIIWIKHRHDEIKPKSIKILLLIDIFLIVLMVIAWFVPYIL